MGAKKTAAKTAAKEDTAAAPAASPAAEPEPSTPLAPGEPGPEPGPEPTYTGKATMDGALLAKRFHHHLAPDNLLLPLSLLSPASRQEYDRMLPQLTLQAAVMAHTLNMGYCHTIGDRSQVTWDNAEEWQRQSALEGAQAVLLGEIMTPRDSHVSWYEAKKAAGWVFGAKKDPEAKTHPCMVDYELLPESQQFKDLLFFTVCTTVGRRALLDLLRIQFRAERLANGEEPVT